VSKFIHTLASFFCACFGLKWKNRIPALKICVADGIGVVETAKVSPWVNVAEVICAMMTMIDDFFEAQSLPRQYRREFWREFAKTPSTRQQTVKGFLSRIEKIGGSDEV